MLAFRSALSLSLSIKKSSIFFPRFIAIIFALVVLFRLCPSYCLNLFSCSSYNNTPYLKRPMLAVGSVCPTLRHVAGALEIIEPTKTLFGIGVDNFVFVVVVHWIILQQERRSLRRSFASRSCCFPNDQQPQQQEPIQ